MREKRILLVLIKWIARTENELSKTIGNLRLSQKTDFDKGKIKFLNGKAQMCRDVLEKVEELNNMEKSADYHSQIKTPKEWQNQ